MTIPQVRGLKEIAHKVDLHLDDQEFAIIMAGYERCIARLIKEAELEEQEVTNK